jgi:hypothetical protein
MRTVLVVGNDEPDALFLHAIRVQQAQIMRK